MELREEKASVQGLKGEQKMPFPGRSFRKRTTSWTGGLVLRCGRFWTMTGNLRFTLLPSFSTFLAHKAGAQLAPDSE